MEKVISPKPGFILVIIQLILLALAIYVGYHGQFDEYNQPMDWQFWPLLKGAGILIVALSLFGCYITNDPNQAYVMCFMGKYKGTIKANGFFMKPLFYSGDYVSLTLYNHEIEPLSVNDSEGVPINIGAVVVYKIEDTYKYTYNVGDAADFLSKQYEIALRKIAKSHSYDALSKEDADFVKAVSSFSEEVGIHIEDAKITALSYDQQVVSAMLQKQQAQAISDAKEIIASNAVAIAKHALGELSEDLTPQERAAFVSRLTIVLCMEGGASPLIQI